MSSTMFPTLALARGSVIDAPPTGGSSRITSRDAAPKPPRWRAAAAVAMVAGLGAGAFLIASAGADDPISSAPVQPAVEPAVDAADLPLGSMYHVVDQIGARALWEQGITGAGVNVAVIDTGVAPVDGLTRGGKVVAAVDLSPEAGNPATAMVDNNGHGTHMAGIIAGRETGADPALAAQHPEWFLGVAPDAGIVSVKVGDRNGDVLPGGLAAAVNWTVDNAEQYGIRVINLSVGSDEISASPFRVDPLSAAVQRAWDAGLVVVVAAGNDGADANGLTTPANDPYVIAVAGADVETTGVRAAEWTSSGDGVRNPDVAAPGAHIQSLRVPGSDADVNHPEGYVDAETFKGSGSSQGAAAVAGSVALLLDARPELTNDQVKALLVASATPLADSATVAGSGLINLEAANRLPAPVVEQTWTRAVATNDLPAAPAVDVPVWSGASWSGASWSGASWSGASWSGASWSGASWSGASWSGASWSGASWSGASWSGASWSGASWSGASWSGASWSGASWSGASWSGASWSGASWSGASWSGASWSGASWSGASWSGASWSGASWSGASWSGASWSGASWSGASWSGASWSGASWSGASWS